MQGVMVRPLSVPWRLVALAAVLIPSVVWSAALLAAVLVAGESFDWWTFEQAAARVGTGTLYDWPPLDDGLNYTFRYSPLFAWLMIPVTALGIGLWRLLHVAALLLLPRGLALLTLLAWPFWEDVWHGNVMTFALVLGFLAMRGGRWAGAGYLILALLVPRPIMMPLLAWLAWQRPEWRLGGAAIAVVVALLTLATGEAVAFIDAILRSTDGIGYGLNLSPSRFVGIWWLAMGIPLAAWLTWRGRVGWASLALSPYLFPYHLLIGLLEFNRSPAHKSVTAPLHHPAHPSQCTRP